MDTAMEQLAFAPAVHGMEIKCKTAEGINSTSIFNEVFQS